MRLRSSRSLLPVSTIGLLFVGAACHSPSEELLESSTTSGGEATTTSTLAEPLALSVPIAQEEEDAQAEAQETTPAPTSSPQEIGTDASRLEIRRQQQAVLSQALTDEGEAKLANGDLRGALAAFAEAVDWQSTNERARQGLRTVQALLGDEFAEASEFFDEAAEREIVRRAQARMAAEQALLDGDNARRDGDLSAALASYHQAEVILGYHPLIASDSLDAALVAERIRSTLDARDEIEAQRRADAEAEAQAEIARLEEEQARNREEFLKRVYTEANAAYQRANYDKAERLAEQILLSDPGNEYAIEMRDIARESRHRAVDERNRRQLHEQWRRTFEDLETLAVPQTEAIVFNDLDRWAEVLDRGPIQFSRPAESADEENERILRRLEQTTVPVRFGEDDEGAPLEDFAEYLQNATGVNFIISPLVLDELDPEDTAVNLNMADRSVKKLLDLYSEISDVRWKVSGGVVRFITIEELIGGQELRFYDVRDLIQPVRDFPGRDINVIPSGGLELPEEDFDEREALLVTGDTLDTLIRDNISPESWDADPANTLQVTESGTLVVNQTPEVHEQIDHLLDGLRESTGIMVDIQARFLRVEDNFLEDIGVDFRGLGAPGLGTNEFFNDFGDASAQAELGAEIGQGNDLGAFFDDGANGNVKARVENLYDGDLGDSGVLTNSGGLSFQWTYLQDLELELILRAVSKSERVELVTAPKLLVHNTARANLTVLNQIAYIYDYDVEIAQGASIADPQVEVIEDGVILDVRPVVSADRRYITLEMRPTVAELVRPVPEFVTSLGGGTAVTIQLPQLEISRVRTSVPMPDGSTVLLGGLKIREEERTQSGIPILNKIPFVSFLFERKGQFVTNRKLLILLKANIVIPSEHEPEPVAIGTAGSR